MVLGAELTETRSMNCLWLVWFMPPKSDTVPVNVLELRLVSAISSPPLPAARKANAAGEVLQRK